MSQQSRLRSLSIDTISGDFCLYVIWLSVELNIVMIASSIPLLRPLFRRNSKQSQNRHEMKRWDSGTVGSVMSRKSPHTITARESEENIIEQPSSLQPRHAIQVTREVTVTYETSDAPFVHAGQSFSSPYAANADDSSTGRACAGRDCRSPSHASVRSCLASIPQFTTLRNSLKSEC